MNLSQKSKISSNKSLIEFTVGETVYKGRNPVYQMMNGKYIKVVSGIPFVRVSKTASEHRFRLAEEYNKKQAEEAEFEELVYGEDLTNG